MWFKSAPRLSARAGRFPSGLGEVPGRHEDGGVHHHGWPEKEVETIVKRYENKYFTNKYFSNESNYPASNNTGSEIYAQKRLVIRSVKVQALFYE